MERGNRTIWVDELKGFGICLVILGHMSIPEMARQWIFSFHMPLFFVVSGYLYKDALSMRWVLKKMDSLLIPYVLYGALTICVWRMCGINVSLHSWILGNGIGVTWFLGCLFVTEIVGAIMIRPFARTRFFFLVILAVAAVGWIVPHLVQTNVLMCRTAAASLAFFLSGYGMKRYDVLVRFWNARAISRVCVSVGLIVLSALFYLQRIDMASALFGNGFLFYGTALSFTFLCFALFCRHSLALRPLSFVGMRSLPLMCLHGLIPMGVVAILSAYGFSSKSSCLTRVVSFILLGCMCEVIHRHCEMFAGRAQIFQRLIRTEG